MDVDFVTAVVAIAASVVAVVAGVERWLLPARRARQYELLTKIRDEEKASAMRRDALEAARNRTAAQLVGSFWVPGYRMAVFVPVLAGLYAATVLLVVRDLEPLWLCLSGVVLWVAISWWRVVHWFGVRQHLISDYLRGSRTSASHYHDEPTALNTVITLTVATVGGALAVGWSIVDYATPRFALAVGFASALNVAIGMSLWAMYSRANPPAALPPAFEAEFDISPSGWRKWLHALWGDAHGRHEARAARGGRSAPGA